MKATRRSILHLQLGQEVIYLLLAVFAITSLILALFLVIKVRKNDDRELERLRGRVEQLQADNQNLRAERDQARRAADQNAQLRHDKPPIIHLKEAEGFRFPSGDATLTPAFKANLDSKVVPEIVASARRYGANIIEVIGHTDEVPVTGRFSNLDSQLIPFLRGGGRSDSPKLDVSDNAGLGMARAAAVAQFLISKQELEGLRVLPLSGAQVIKNDEFLSTGSEPKESADRRRIEIRVRRPN